MKLHSLIEIIAGLLSRAVLEGNWTRRTVWTQTNLTERRWNGDGTERWRIVWISLKETARRLLWPTHPSGCDHVIQDSGVIRQDRWDKRLNTDWYRPYGRSFPQPAPFPAVYSPISTATRHRCQDTFHIVPNSEGGVMWGPLAVGVSLAGLGWPTMSTFIMMFMNVTKITDWHPV